MIDPELLHNLELTRQYEDAEAFVCESNRIERILRAPTPAEIREHLHL